MKLFGRRRQQSREDLKDTRERLPKTLPAQCLGEKCVNFSGVECKAYEDLLNADGSSGATDLPPYRDEASYALYGRICTGGEEEMLVNQRAEILKPGVNNMMLIAISGRYGDLPLVIEDGAQTTSIDTIASSDQ